MQTSLMVPERAGIVQRGHQVPKSREKARDWDAELRFFQDWCPSSGGSTVVPRVRDNRLGIEAQAGSREKRPRDCCKHAPSENSRPEKRGGARAGGGRPPGSKVTEARKQREKTVLAEEACKEGWRKGVEYFRAVVKERLGGAAVATAGMEVSLQQ